MNHESNQYDPVDVDIDRTLSALRTAAPPAGMDDRILSRLDARLTEPRPSSAFSAIWLRGALTGALAATAACAALFFATRLHHTTAPQIAAIAHHAPAVTPAALHINDQCTGAPSIRDGHGADGWDERSSARESGAPLMRDEPALSEAGRPSRTGQSAHEWDAKPPHLVPASFAPSHPAPPAPLTAQERSLVQLVRNASPAELAALNPAVEEKADAEREASFQKFFAPSPELLSADRAQREALGLDPPTTPPTEVHN